jgi:phosphate transport system ATP-binding protein
MSAPYTRPTTRAKDMTELETGGRDPERTGTAERAAEAQPPAVTPAQGRTIALRDLNAYYGDTHAVRGVSLDYVANQVTAMIGPSGCGKSTLVRCINRMHEEIPGARAEGAVTLDDFDVYDDSVDVVAVRRVIGMVFQ